MKPKIWTGPKDYRILSLTYPTLIVTSRKNKTRWQDEFC